MKPNFEQIKRTAKIKGECEVCGKNRVKTISSEQTINPFNKNKDGTIKSRFEVDDSVREELREKIKIASEHFICATCYSNLPWPKKWPNNQTITNKGE